MVVSETLADAVNQGEPLTPILIGNHAEQGDQLAMSLVMETADWLAIGIVTLMHTIDPSAIILGGAMTFGRDEHPVGRAFLDRIDTCVRRHTFPTLAKQTALRFATLGGNAGSIGAARPRSTHVETTELSNTRLDALIISRKDFLNAVRLPSIFATFQSLLTSITAKVRWPTDYWKTLAQLKNVS